MSAQHLLSAHTSNRSSLQHGGNRSPEAEEEQSKQQFPPRKRSIPLGFDFDLDEVWSARTPFGRHRQEVLKTQPNGDAQDEKGYRNNSSLEDSSTTETRNTEKDEETSDILKKIHQLTVGLDSLSSTSASMSKKSDKKTLSSSS